MFKSIKDWFDLKFDLVKESLSLKFTNYKGLWENQNIQIDSMKCKHSRETRSLNARITNQDNIIKEEKSKSSQIPKLKYLLKRQKARSKRGYLELKNENKELLDENVKLISEKRILASSKGGLISKIKSRDKKIAKLESENKAIKKLIQKVVKESKNKITPPTMRELENYELFGNRKGKRK